MSDLHVNGEQINKETQISEELIHIMNSCDVTVTTTDTQVALNIQVLLQILLALIARLDVL